MTLYVGERTLVYQTADRDGTEFTDENVTAVWISIYQGTDVVVAETLMTWTDVRERWEYIWDTTSEDAGSFKVKIRIEGIDGGSVWEWSRIRLSRNPV